MTTYYLRHKASQTFVNACDTMHGFPNVEAPEGHEWIPEDQVSIQQMRDYERDVYPGYGT